MAFAQASQDEARRAQNANEVGVERVPVVIMFNEAGDVPRARGLVEARGGEVTREYSIIPGVAANLPRQAIEGLERNPLIAVVEEDRGDIELLSISSELNNTWGVQHIGAGTPHANGVRGSGVRVAVIDTGVDANHPDLAGNVAGGYDFVANTSNVTDTNGHGTHVAGTIAALRNGAGVVGVAPEVELYALKITDASHNISLAAIIAAVDWSVQNSMQVTNSSFGTSWDYASIKEAYDNAAAAGVLHVAAAGNSGNSWGIGDYVQYPAKYDSVIAVASVNASNVRANTSSHGPAVELSAPGVDINSAVPGGGYGVQSGTSMASPHVAGVAALVMSAGVTNPAQVRQILRDTATPLGSSSLYGYGLVRADAAVVAAGGTPPPPSGSVDIAVTNLSVASSATVGDSVPVSVTIQNVGTLATSETITITLQNQTTGQTIGTQQISGGLAAGASATRSFAWNTSNHFAGTYTLRASHNINDGTSGNNAMTASVALTAPSGGGGVNAMGVQQMTATQGWFGPTIAATIRRDSNNDGQLTTADATVSSASVTLRVIHDSNNNGVFDCNAGDQCWNFNLSTNFSGQLSRSISFAPNGNYKAEIINLTHGTYSWSPSLDNQNPIFFTR